MDAPTKLAATFGRIDRVTIDHSKLLVEGWTISFESDPIDTIMLSIAGNQISAFDMQKIPSPDVKRIFPDLEGSEQARFLITVPIDDQQRGKIGDSLLILTPMLKGRTGTIMVKTIEPSLPMPSEEHNLLVGGGDFINISNEFLGLFIRLTGLQPTEQVLDIGCGVGRMAYSLAYYLKPPGRYEGFDIMAPLVQWASETIGARYPHFTFRHANIANQAYNPNGPIRSIDFVFPYADQSFDFVFLTSVFTHMFPADVRHYLDEIRRVLKPGGRCLTTCFLLNDESQRLLAEGKGVIKMVHKLDGCFTANPGNPERAIGFSEPVLLKWIGDRGFTVAGKYYGSWCGRSSFTTSHDLLLFEKSR